MNVGITVVVAAGNQGIDACERNPAHVRFAITVGAILKSNKPRPHSNFGPCVDIFAPGTDTLSFGHGSDTQLVRKSGTSMACPHVSGAAALLLEEDPTQTPAQVRSRLTGSARRGVIDGLRAGEPDLLLFIGGTIAKAPANATFPPGPMPAWDDEQCPAFSSTREPDDKGDCACPYGTSCSMYKKDSKYSRNRRGVSDRTACKWSGTGLNRDVFSVECNTCVCSYDAM